jgi:PAS domain S-box-containing protein
MAGIGDSGAKSPRGVPPKVLLEQALVAKDVTNIVQALASCLQRPNYSVVQLFRDAADIREQIGKAGKAVGPLLTNWAKLERTMGESLALASTAYEKFVESTVHAFCEINEKAVIVSANQKMFELMPDCIGRSLPDCFGKNAQEVREGLASGQRRLCQLSLDTMGRPYPVLAEFGTYESEGRRGGFALLVDLKEAAEAEHRALEAAPYGMLKLDAQYCVADANQVLLDLVGVSALHALGRDPREFLADEDSRVIAMQQFEERRQGRGGEYELTLKTKNGRQVRVRVASHPSYDATGRFAGVLASVVPIDAEIARKELARLVAMETHFERLFDGVIEIVRRFVPFDWADLSLYTKDRDFVLSVCRDPNPQPDRANKPKTDEPESARPYGMRWFEVKPAYRTWIDQECPCFPDLKAFLEETADGRKLLEENEDMKRAVDEGRRAVIAFPVRGQAQGKEQIIGALSLQSKHAGIYNSDTMAVLKGLALEQPLQAIFIAREQAEKEFSSDLLAKVAAATNLVDIANLIVSEIARFYHFQNVSIFKINKLRGYFSLLAQQLGPQGGMPIPQGYVQSLAEGLLGLCYHDNKVINLHDCNDVKSKEAKVYKKVSETTVSELCIPIELRKRLLWILNLEDSRRNAFYTPEITTLQEIVNKIDATIDHLFEGNVLREVLQVFPEAVLIAKTDGNVLLGNDNAGSLLGVDDTFEGLNLRRLLSEDDYNTAVSDKNAPEWMTSVTGADKRKTPVLMSKFLLPEEYDHVIIVLKDVTEWQWKTDLQRLTAALSEASAQVRVPLSLVSSFVQQIGRKTSEPEFQDLASKAMSQLHRVELTYDRVFGAYDAGRLPSAQRITIDINQAINDLLENLPKSDRATIRVTSSNGAASVRADPYRVVFALESMLTYLLRARASASAITIEVRRASSKIEVVMTGPVERTDVNGGLEKIVESTRMDIALGEPLLERIAAECGGSFSRQRKRGKGGYEQLSIQMRRSRT